MIYSPLLFLSVCGTKQDMGSYDSHAVVQVMLYLCVRNRLKCKLFLCEILFHFQLKSPFGRVEPVRSGWVTGRRRRCLVSIPLLRFNMLF